MNPGERVIRASASVIVGAFAVSLVDNLWYAIPAGLCAIFVLISAITGWCHTAPSASCRVTDQPIIFDKTETETETNFKTRQTVTSDHH